MRTGTKIKVALVVPHIFLHQDILKHVIFSPGHLALALSEKIRTNHIEVTLCTPGPAATTVSQINADLSLFQKELDARGDTYLDLLKKHPFTFVTLARQVQVELIANIIQQANKGDFDIVHIYGNEEEIALPLASFCQKPIVFTHHDPYNFLVKYRSIFPKYKHLNWISMSLSQRQSMPKDAHWVGNIYHGLDKKAWSTKYEKKNYIAYLGRIIESKGLHLAIKAVNAHNKNNPSNPLILKIAGKHYQGKKDNYWKSRIEPTLGEYIQYVGYIDDQKEKQAFLQNAQALIVPSIFEEPFGMVLIEALACGTPIIGLDSGAIPEIIKDGETGFLVAKKRLKNGDIDETSTAQCIASVFSHISSLNTKLCRDDFEKRFTLDRMATEHAALYRQLIK